MCVLFLARPCSCQGEIVLNIVLNAFFRISEGQKKAHSEEWETQKKTYTDKITDLKKDIKDLTGKLECTHNPSKKTTSKKKSQVPRKIQLPVGAKSAEQGVQILDLKVITIRFCKVLI